MLCRYDRSQEFKRSLRFSLRGYSSAALHHMYLRCIALRRIVISSSVFGLSSPHLILPSHKYQLRDPRSKIVTPFLGEHGGHCSQETRPWPRRFGIAVLRAEGSLENKVSRRNGAESTQRNEAVLVRVLEPLHRVDVLNVSLGSPSTSRTPSIKAIIGTSTLIKEGLSSGP